MARRTSLIRYDKIFISLLFLLFGIIALVVGYQAVKTDADVRSKAAETHAVYQRWEFNGTTTEGWTVISPSKVTVKSGALLVSMLKGRLPTLEHNDVKTPLPNGLKSVSLSMAVGAPQIPTTTKKPEGCPTPPECPHGVIELPVGARCPVYRCAVAGTAQSTGSVGSSQPGTGWGGASASPRRKPSARIFSATVYYQKSDKNEFEKAADFSGTVDGKFQTYSVALPDIAAIDLSKIRIVFTSGMKTGETASVDWIRLVGPVKPILTKHPSITPTPVYCEGPDGSPCELGACPTCAPGKMCPAIACRLQTGTCRNNECVRDTHPKQTPTPSGCHYIQPRCFMKPCDPILVCPTPVYGPD